MPFYACKVTAYLSSKNVIGMRRTCYSIVIIKVSIYIIDAHEKLCVGFGFVQANSAGYFWVWTNGLLQYLCIKLILCLCFWRTDKQTKKHCLIIEVWPRKEERSKRTLNGQSIQRQIFMTQRFAWNRAMSGMNAKPPLQLVFFQINFNVFLGGPFFPNVWCMHTVLYWPYIGKQSVCIPHGQLEHHQQQKTQSNSIVWVLHGERRNWCEPHYTVDRFE